MAQNGNRKRVSIFVDGANMFYTQKKGLGWFFDPAKLLKVLRGDDELTDAYWYMGIKQPPDPRDENFVRFLAYAGYVVRKKDLKTIYDAETGESTQKANLDVEIVMDMFNTLENYDKAILLSGDGDFERALDPLRFSRQTNLRRFHPKLDRLRTAHGRRFALHRFAGSAR